MKPVRLELNHLGNARRPARASWILLAAAIAFAGDVAVGYFKTGSEIEAKTVQLARFSNARSAGDSTAQTSLATASQEELLAARDTILLISMPWDNIFRALESARSKDVALLSIEPDPASGAVSISGESKSYPALLTYVAWLSNEKTLKDVRLARHEIPVGDSRRTVLFTISANWKEGR